MKHHILIYFLTTLTIVYSYSLGQTLTYTSSSDIYLAKRDSSIVSNYIYVSYNFTNGATACDDAWAELETIIGLEGNLRLSANEDGFMRIGSIAASATSMIFFYLYALDTTDTSGSLTTKVYCGKPNDVGSTLLVTDITTRAYAIK